MKISIKNPINGATLTHEGLLDTGYDGLILLSWDAYVELGLRKCELPRKLWSTGVSVTGEEFLLRAAYAEVELGRARRLVLVETYRDNVRRLVGRGFIEPYIAILDGPKKLLRVECESTSSRAQT